MVSMSRLSTLWLAWLSLITLVASSAIIKTPLTPSNDPFYTPPWGYESTAPGTILRSRTPPSPLAAFGLIPLNLKAAFQILYRTTDSLGCPTSTVTTVLVPQNANISRLLSYQDIEDSSFINCASSYALQQGVGTNTTLSQLSILFVAGFLELGYYVSIPDFEGPQSAFGSGIQAGQAVLDSIRAVLKSSAITWISPGKVDITMWGYSGGSIGTEWAAELQPSYAPELWITGAVTGGITSDLVLTLLAVNKAAAAGLAVTGFLGLANAYPVVANFLNSNLNALTAPLFKSAGTRCATSNAQLFAFQDIGSYFEEGVFSLIMGDLIAVVNETAVMGNHGLPTIPLYFFGSVQDEICPIGDVDRLVENYCAAKISSLHYVRNLVGEHVQNSFYGFGQSLAFIQDRFNGVPAIQGCLVEHVVVSDLDTLILESFGAQIFGAMEALLGLPLGPSSWT